MFSSASSTYNLKRPARCIAALASKEESEVGDEHQDGGGGEMNTSSRFVVGTCSLREPNELRILGFHEESNELLCHQVCFVVVRSRRAFRESARRTAGAATYCLLAAAADDPLSKGSAASFACCLHVWGVLGATASFVGVVGGRNAAATPQRVHSSRHSPAYCCARLDRPFEILRHASHALPLTHSCISTAEPR